MNHSTTEKDIHLTNIKSILILSTISCVLMVLVSVSGIIYSPNLYISQELIESFLPNDYINLMIGLPVLVLSIIFARKDSTRGLLFLPGALLYVIYNYIAYSLALLGSPFFPVYLIIVLTSTFALIILFKNLNRSLFGKVFIRSKAHKITAIILIFFGTVFLIRVFSLIGGSVIKGQSLTASELAVNVADLLTTPLWIIAGVSLLRKKEFGYISVPGVVLQGSMLFLGLLLLFIIQPLLTETLFKMEDFIVIAVMGLFFFIPMIQQLKYLDKN